MNKKRRFSVLIITVILILAIAYHNSTDRAVAADNTFKDASGEYIITDDTQMEVQFTGLSKKSATSVEIPSTIKINEQEYKVTGVKANALNGNKKVVFLFLQRWISWQCLLFFQIKIYVYAITEWREIQLPRMVKREGRLLLSGICVSIK